MEKIICDFCCKDITNEAFRYSITISRVSNKTNSVVEKNDRCICRKCALKILKKVY